MKTYTAERAYAYMDFLTVLLHARILPAWLFCWLLNRYTSKVERYLEEKKYRECEAKGLVQQRKPVYLITPTDQITARLSEAKKAMDTVSMYETMLERERARRAEKKSRMANKNLSQNLYERDSLL